MANNIKKFSSRSFIYDMQSYEEPPVMIEDVVASYNNMPNVFVKAVGAVWKNGPTEYPCYTMQCEVGSGDKVYEFVMVDGDGRGCAEVKGLDGESYFFKPHENSSSVIRESLRLANILDSKGLTKEADVLDLLIRKLAEDDLNLEDEDVEFSPYGHYDLEVYPEPPVNIEDVKAAFVAQFKRFLQLDNLEVISIEWDSKPSEYPHYNVESVGTYTHNGERKETSVNTDYMLTEKGWGGSPVQGTDDNIYYFYGEA